MATAYIASPLGFSETTRAYYCDVLLCAIRDAGIEPLDPWADPTAEHEFAEAQALPAGEQRLAALRAVNGRLGEANARMIGRADGMLAVLDGADVDSGTAAEIGFAAAQGKPIAALRLDVRQTGDNEGAAVNLQVEYFIAATGGAIERSLDAAVALLARLLAP
ncbi:MAG: 2-deoxyribonucleoside glycosidase [Actinobacteria bacterium]|nr:MAG: 2-deoxyribonucleoside glycosidase [Actinomycetota bacterium]